MTETLDRALVASGLDQVKVMHRPRLLTDNGSSYIAGDLAEWLKRRGMTHIRGGPHHPQTQGKIERWHQTLKNRILLEPYYLPSELEAQVGAFVEHYNQARAHESLNNLNPPNLGEAVMKFTDVLTRLIAAPLIVFLAPNDASRAADYPTKSI